MDLKDIINNGALAIAFSVFINYITTILKNKTHYENKKNELDNIHNGEIFKILKNQFEQMNEINNKNFNYEINEIKRLILNSSNMNTNDFEIFMQYVCNNIILNLEKEMNSIIDRNHIDNNTIDLTIKKVDNLIEKLINNQIYKIQSLNFDNAKLKQIANFNTHEKELIKSMMEEIINNYVQNDSEYKKEEAKRQIEENVKYIYNSFECQLYSILDDKQSL